MQATIMKALLLYAIVVSSVLLWTATGETGEYVLVPKTLEEIINPNFRSALETQAYDYDSLSRYDQLRTFVQVYKSLNRGQDPLLSPLDSDLFLGAAPLYAASAAPPPPPASYENAQSGDVYQYYHNYGYRRFPSVSPGPPPEGVRVLRYPPAPVQGIVPVAPSPVQSGPARPQTPPPYARPPVAEPHTVEQVHAGP